MLKSIVQYDDLGVEDRDRMMSDDTAIAADQYGNPGCMGRENKGFVAGMRNARMHERPIRYDRDRQTAMALVATAREYDAPPSPAEAQREACGEGRFPRPTDGQPAHAHHRASESTAPRRGATHEHSM